MGCHPQITARAGPHPPPPQRRPGPAPPRERSLAPTNHPHPHPLLGRQAMVSPPFHPGTMPSAPPIHHSRTRFQGGQGRAATLFACGAGPLWRGFARGTRMISRPAQPLRPWPVPAAKTTPPKNNTFRLLEIGNNYDPRKLPAPPRHQASLCSNLRSEI